MIAPASPWPFVGRDAEVAVALDVLADATSGGVLAVGPAGVGKTRLLDELTARLIAGGRTVQRVVGATATQAIPFAAVAHLLPSDVLRDGGAPDPIGVFAHIQARAREHVAPGERLVMVVDDVALLDHASLALLTQLVTSGTAAVLATARDDDATPAVAASLERSHELARLEVRPLDVDQVHALLEEVQGGIVDRRTSRTLWTASQGNVLYLRELVIGALASGALAAERGHWHLAAPLTATSRLTDAVAARLNGLPDPARELAEVLAVAEPLRIDDLERAGFGDAAMALDDAGLVAADDVDGTTLVRLGHPMYGEVLRTRLTTLRRRKLLLQAANAVAAAARPDDALRLATWLTAANAPVDPAILRQGALRARAASDLQLTERLARAAVDQAADLDMLLLLAEALHELGRVGEASRTLAAAADHVHSDLDRLRVADMHHRVLLWGASDPAGSLAVLEAAEAATEDAHVRALLRVSMANNHAFGTDPRRTLEVPTAEDLADPTIAALAAHARSTALVRLGRPVEGIDVAVSGRTALPEAGGNVAHPAMLLLCEGVARTEAGDLAGAEAVVRQGYSIVVDQHIPQLHVWLACELGRVALLRGRVAAARRSFAEALAVATDSRFATGTRMALTSLATAVGHLGDVHAAAALLAELDQLQPDIAFTACEVPLGRAWALVALGRPSDALAAVREGVALAASTDDVLLQHQLLYEATRLGARGTVWPELRVLDVEGDLPAARTALVEGLAKRSARVLADAEARFAAIGADLAAAEAGALLAAQLAGDGRRRDAAAASARSAEHHARCEGATTPVLQARHGVAPLTARERETAQLAARGMTSKAIARTLGVTERTVSNHLQSAYVKLGISSRSELAEALGTSAT